MVERMMEQLTLRFYEREHPSANSVAAAALAQSLDAFQRIVLLLAMRREGRAPGRRVRPSADIQARYRLLCDLPEKGSYITPLRIEGTGDLLAETEISGLMAQLCGVMDAIGKADEVEFEKSLPDDTWRRLILGQLERLSPVRATGFELELSVGKSVLMDTATARPFVEHLVRAPTRQKARGVVVGEFKRIDFMKREITVRHQETGRELTCLYQDYVEDSLLEHPRDTLLVFGAITRNAQNEPVSIEDVERIEAVNLGGITITSVPVGDIAIQPKEMLSASVIFDEEDALFVAEIPSLRVKVHAETREMLEEAILDELALLWKRYAMADDAKLTPAAQTLKGRMLAAFHEDMHDA